MGLLSRMTEGLFGPPARREEEPEELEEGTPAGRPTESLFTEYRRGGAPPPGRSARPEPEGEEPEEAVESEEPALQAPARIRGWEGRWHRGIHRQFRTEPGFGPPALLRRFKRRERALDASYASAAARGRETLADWQISQRRHPRSAYRQMMRTYDRALRGSKESMRRSGASERDIRGFEKSWHSRYGRIERLRGRFLTRSRRISI